MEGPHLVVAFVCLMGISWIFANPPGYAPDEPAHHAKAIGVGRGVWVGSPGEYPVGPGFGPAQLEWINKAARVVVIPPNLAPDALACSVFQPDKSAACLYHVHPPPDVAAPRLTYVGTYEPFLYLLPGLVMNRADDATTALLLGRSVSGAIALALLAAGAGVLWRPGEGGYPLIGLIAATTPMVVHLAAGLSPTGPEIGAAVCTMAVVWRLARPEPPTGPVWLALAAGGSVLALGRSLGPFFLLADVLLLLAALGPRRSYRIFRGGGLAALFAVVVVLVAVAANVAWGLIVQPQPPFDARSVLSWVGPSMREVPEVLRQDVGQFGWADVSMPKVAYVAWGGLVAALVGVAFVVGRRRQRAILAGVVTGCFVGTVLIAAAAIHQTHFPMYGRYVLPLWIAVPLCAGEMVLMNRRRLGPLVSRTIVVGTAVAAAAVHFTGFYANARRYAVSNNGPVLFLGRSEWSPWGGWKVWMALVGLGVLALVAYGVLSSRRSLSHT